MSLCMHPYLDILIWAFNTSISYSSWCVNQGQTMFCRQFGCICSHQIWLHKYQQQITLGEHHMVPKSGFSPKTSRFWMFLHHEIMKWSRRSLPGDVSHKPSRIGASDSLSPKRVVPTRSSKIVSWSFEN